MVLVVERCKALDQESPIHNIWVDEENVKWVANTKGLFKVLALDLVQPASIPGGSESLLNIRGGNAKIEWSIADMSRVIGANAVANITCAAYDTKSKSLWIGTRENGAFQLTLDPLRLVQQFNTDNKKLTSNQINDIFTQPNGTIWIATNDGMLTGSGDKWLLQERYLNFIGVDSWNQNVWILGDDLMWQVDARGKWNAVAIEPRNVEGQLRDIAVDDEGRVWIASNMMTGFNAEQNRYQRFGPGQYFTSQFVNCLDVDQDGSIWTGTDDKGLYLIQWEAAMTVNLLMETPLDCKAKTPNAVLQTKITGGTAPYSYQWSNGQTTEKLSQIGAGLYQLTVTDAKGIVKTVKYEIPDPNMKITTELVTPSSGSPEGDGSANILVDGGAAPFTYTWDNGETVKTAVRLVTGNHTVTITDVSGCVATASINVPEKTLPLTVFAKFLSSNTCAEARDGVAEVEVSGGKAPFTYKWSIAEAGNAAKASNLPSGLYSVTVTDANGTNTSTSVNIPAPPQLQVSATMISPATANMMNGQVRANTAGGSSPYTFTWSNNTTGANVLTMPGGTHTVTVTDANGCSATASVTVTENINALGAIIKRNSRIACYGDATGSLSLDITGGKKPYTYSWSNGQTKEVAENLEAGEYTVTVSDAAANTFTAAYTLDEPEPITIVASVESAASANKADGRASVKVSGGAGNYQYAWSNGEKTNKAIALPAGKFNVTVTDESGCTNVTSFEVNENITDLIVTIEQKEEVLCAGATNGGVTANVRGGKEPYTFKWNTAGSSTSISDLGDGLYALTVTDAAGQTATSVFTLNSPPPIKIEAKVDGAASLNKQDGKATATASGGKGKLSFRWSNGETAAKAVALGPGTHSVVVTDENNCTAEASVTITENILPLATTIVQSQEINCAGDASAALKAEITGGKPPYVYNWKGNSQTWTTAELSNLKSGDYILDVTDASGLAGKATIQVNEPAPIKLIVDEITPATTNNADGKAVVKISGGTSPYALDGSGKAAAGSSLTVDGLKPGSHMIRVKDAAGCVAEIEVVIKENITALQVLIAETQQIKCAGDANAALELELKGGKTPYTVKWEDNSSGIQKTSLKAGKYVVTVTDAAGQSGVANYTVKQPLPLELYVSSLRSATNDRISDGKGTAEANGGGGGFVYQWSSGETGHQAFKLPLGAGHVIVTDQNGCTMRTEFVIKEKVLPELTATNLASGEPIRMEKIQFQADSINVNEEAKPSLDELYEFLYDNPTVIIEVAGHTNGLPADEYCDRISAERADKVAKYIVEKGIEARRVIAKGYGKRKPIATNQTAEGRKKNQRVEIRLIKIEE
jgi:outer membrane protein OmpA-like peptidoglycan-associated protein